MFCCQTNHSPLQPQLSSYTGGILNTNEKVFNMARDYKALNLGLTCNRLTLADFVALAAKTWELLLEANGSSIRDMID
jgi:hypothetical protein